jgi:hypothetical protein
MIGNKRKGRGDYSARWSEKYDISYRVFSFIKAF